MSDAEEHIFKLHDDLTAGLYKHGAYVSFFVKDPKLRHIHKASVRDRLLHHAVHRVLYPYFDKKFIFDSFSSRKDKGAHAAIKRFRNFAWKISGNRSRAVWVLKADIRKFFDSIDHKILIDILVKSLPDDEDLFRLLINIIQSFEAAPGKGIPLGNLTSQLFSNIYLNSLDQFAKRRLGLIYYIRYADDITILSSEKGSLEKNLVNIGYFLENSLLLYLHPFKVTISRWDKGIDVLGFISTPYSTVIRSNTKRRMFSRLARVGTRVEFCIQEQALYSRVKFER